MARKRVTIEHTPQPGAAAVGHARSRCLRPEGEALVVRDDPRAVLVWTRESAPISITDEGGRDCVDATFVVRGREPCVAVADRHELVLHRLDASIAARQPLGGRRRIASSGRRRNRARDPRRGVRRVSRYRRATRPSELPVPAATIERRFRFTEGLVDSADLVVVGPAGLTRWSCRHPPRRAAPRHCRDEAEHDVSRRRRDLRAARKGLLAGSSCNRGLTVGATHESTGRSTGHWIVWCFVRRGAARWRRRGRRPDDDLERASNAICSQYCDEISLVLRQRNFAHRRRCVTCQPCKGPSPSSNVAASLRLGRPMWTRRSSAEALPMPRSREISLRRTALLSLLLVACSSEDERSEGTPCERMRDHIVNLRLADVTGIDRTAHREKLRRALGSSFVANCKESMTDEQVTCVLNALDSGAATACVAAVKH